MRVEAYHQVSRAYGSSKPSKVKGSRGAGKRDVLQISQTARDYQVAKQAVAEAPDIREDKVAQLKSSIASGNYQVSNGDFAAKLLEKYEAYMRK